MGVFLIVLATPNSLLIILAGVLHLQQNARRCERLSAASARQLRFHRWRARPDERRAGLRALAAAAGA